MPYNTGNNRGGKNWTRNKYMVGSVVMYHAQIIFVEEMCRTRVAGYYIYHHTAISNTLSGQVRRMGNSPVLFSK